MIRINQIKIPIFEIASPSGTGDPELENALLRKKTARLLKVREDGIRKLRIVRRSVDARDRKDILFVYMLDVRLHDSISGPSAETEQKFVAGLRNRNVTALQQMPVRIEPAKEAVLRKLSEDGTRPVVCGSGPCGLFAAHTLCLAGLKPIVIERGQRVEKRRETVDRFFETGKLDTESNVQFGEGGAGTFSDGKLNTSIKGEGSYIRYVLEQFCRYGAGEEILYEQKPHIGTDVLTDVVKAMREDIIRMGGSFLFETCLTGIEADTALSAVFVKAPGNHTEREALSALCGRKTAPGERVRIPATKLILAVGHSARDTIAALYEQGLLMEQKNFAMGLRIQHPQKLIDEALYGADRLLEKEQLLGPSPYKLTHRAENGRGIYSFCMCPGGYVVNASSEEGRLCVNGMSEHDRDSGIANSALIVTVGTADFPSEHPLSGMELQRDLEEKAYALCNGAIPCETWEDFREGRTEEFHAAAFEPAFKGYYAYADLGSILPSFIREAILSGMPAFGRSIRGFDAPSALFAGIETRTSSPVRIVRNEAFLSNIDGIYPAGEGAGYAGGITSAAIDGIRAAQRLSGQAS
ncbi:MAG: FAD-dependent oxidoreductase [Eubacteriales bacterium]|nr:FAD-dependent oxidoreductase [Eubacteriales bacterium]